MSEQFNLEIVSPEKSFLKKDNVTEVVVPAFEGEMGILKDHISIISFLKPGIIKIFSGNEEENFYVDDGIPGSDEDGAKKLIGNLTVTEDGKLKFDGTFSQVLALAGFRVSRSC